MGLERSFYGSWTGYSVPLRPLEPIDYPAAEARRTFVVIELDEKGRVVTLEDYLVNAVREDAALLAGRTLTPGLHFFAAESAAVGRPLTIDETRWTRSYYRARVSQGGAMALERVERERTLRHRYTYGESGRLAEARYDADEGEEHVQRFDAKGEPLGPPVAS